MSEHKQVVVNTQDKMDKSIESFKQSLAKIRTGRAQASLLDHIHVEVYGQMTALSHVANISVLDSKTLSVSPWDKSTFNSVEKAIRESDLNLNPVSMGDLIKVPLPAINEERRKELVKVIKTEGEGAKVTIRNLRRDANDSFKKQLKEKLISEDDERRAQDEVQKMTDKYIQSVEKLLADKEKELLTI
ncbi:MAG: Ribosome-recycling factor [Pseudomonadota bacterium]